MSRLAWLTDIHLDFLNLEQLQNFAYKALEDDPEAFVISGDISIAPMLHTHLRILEHYWQRPIYFVLGNHDYYRGSIESIRRDLPAFTKKYTNLKWLPFEGVIPLSSKMALIGHGGWADGRAGVGSRSPILLNDYALTKELTGHDYKTLYRVLGEYGDRAAVELEPILLGALENFDQVIAVTHAPPFAEAAWFRGALSNGEFLPHMVCQAVGTMMKKIMISRPEKSLTVLCGHTHGQGEAQILPNLRVKTGGARYGHPCINELLNVAE